MSDERKPGQKPPTPSDADVTRVSPPVSDGDATRLSPHDADATRLSPPAPDADATRMAPATPPPDADATRMTPPTPPDADATSMATPADPDETVLTPTPVSKPPAARSMPASGEDGPLTIGDTFGRYTIVRLLGIGGMGAVYQAWDKELEVVVALKVIRPEVQRDPVMGQELERRFKRELLLARQVTHKNVVRIHDLGEINGIKYITMSYVDGTDLSTLLKKEGRLPIAQTLRIMRSVVSGLVSAHTAGVVHRDLKPANIMIDADGEAMIMDFGIARSTGGPADAPAVAPRGVQATGRYTEGTVLGSVVGTVEYMAPEQARGLPVDQRADIYTTGLILYDMLAGTRRKRPAGSLDELIKRIDEPLPPLKAIAPDVPDALVAVVNRAVEPEREKRFQATAELADALARLDENGVPLPIKRAVSLPIMAGIVAVLLAVAGGAWYWAGLNAPVVEPDPVSVVIADFDNRTGDATFDRTLEPTLRRALEGAGFITAFDRNGIIRTVGVRDLPEKLDEAAASELAVKQGLGVVLAGIIEPRGGGYNVSMKATRPVTGEVVANVSGRASGPDEVVPTATRLVSSIRKSLGDPMSESDQIFAMTSLSASSLEVVRYYAAGMEASSNNQFEEARQNLQKAVQLDPQFGVGYLVLSGVARNLGQTQDATSYINEALSHLDGMTEREQYTTRGMYFRLTGDYKQCVKEHQDLIQRYEADVVGRNQLALCASQLRDLAGARDNMKAVVDLLPQRAVFRDNLSLYSNYASDFETGEQQARKVLEIVPNDPYAPLALALAQMGQGKMADAIATFNDLAPTSGLGKTLAASGLADIAVYQGRYADAIRLSTDGAAADLAAKSPDRAAAKLAEQAYAELLRGRKAAAAAAADRALAASPAVKIRFLAGRIFVEAGQTAKAEALMKDLLAEIQAEPQAYGKILAAMLAMGGTDPRPAIKLASDANDLLDTWIGHFELGRAYLAAGQFTQADSEFDRCLKRRGEAIALFLDEEPTYGYLPMVYYYQGRAREGMKLAGAADSYGTYLDIRGAAGEDALLADVRKRAGR